MVATILLNSEYHNNYISVYAIDLRRCVAWCVNMAGSETSFNSYTFTYNWKVNALETRLHNPVNLSSPSFSSPSRTRPATKWMLTVFKSIKNEGAQPSSGKQSLSLDLTRLPVSRSPEAATGVTNVVLPLNFGQPQGIGGEIRPGSGGFPLNFSFAGSSPPPVPSTQKQNDDAEAVWVEARLTPSTHTGNMTSPRASATQGPTKLHSQSCKPGLLGVGINTMSFQNFLAVSTVRGSKSVTFSCQIKVWSLDKPIHVPNELRPLVPLPNLTNTDEASDFNLSKHMEEARQNELFTDVTLIADGKEFKAHKVILASQSQFFKTRFSNRWTGPGTLSLITGDRVEMTDVPAVVMEAILSYMYTGNVADIGKIAYQLLPVSEEYGLIGLRKMCEKALIKSLKSTNAIDMLIHGAAHNAPDLKKATMDFIVTNTAAVRQSEGWGKLKQTQIHRDLWMELLESIAERHSTANSTGTSGTRAPQLKFDLHTAPKFTL